MTSGDVLQLASLPGRHSIGQALLSAYGTSTVVRLARSPTPIPPEARSRPIQVERRTEAGEAVSFEKVIGWKGLPDQMTDDCETWEATKNERVITEEAAVGVMALLVNDLEGGQILSVLQIGSGGDYVLTRDSRPETQVEASGIFIDATGYDSSRRIQEKCRQVVKKSPHGIAAVTTFSHKATQDVLCRVYFVSGAIDDRRQNPSRRRARR